MPQGARSAFRPLFVVLVVLVFAGAAGAQVTITNVAPRSGPVAGGTRVTITGTNLSDGASSVVTFGGVSGTIEAQNATSITVLTPAQASAGARDVVVTSASGSATRVDGFRYTFDASLKRQDRTVSGGAGSGGTYQPALSGDGRYLAFTSGWAFDTGSTLSGVNQIFVRDRTKEASYQAGNLVRISQAPNGADPDGASGRPRISADGRFVAFWSDATNLVAADTNGQRDVFVHDRDVDEDGVFDEPGQRATYLVSRKTSGTQGNGPSGGNDLGLDLSPDGQWVAFASAATNLVDGDTNNVADVFLHDLLSGETVRASVSTAGTQADGASRAPGVSRNGLLVVFASDATNLVAGDVLGHRDVFVRDRLASATLRLTQLPGGQEANGPSDNPSIDDDGLAVVLETNAKNLLPELAASTATQVVVFSLRLGTLSGVSVPGGRTQAGLTNIADAIRRLLSGSEGGAAGQAPGNGASTEPEVCASGECVTYGTKASNLNTEADPDQNDLRDVVLQTVEPTPAPAERISKDKDGNEVVEQFSGPLDSFSAAVDGTGAVAAVATSADLDLPGEAALGNGNVFVRGTSIVVSTISPSFAYASIGDQVAIGGGGFEDGVAVRLGTTAVTTYFDTADSIRFVVGAGALPAGTYDVTVTNPNGESRRVPKAFTLFGPPTVTSVVPSAGPVTGGTAITVTGTNFVSGQTTLEIGDTAATAVVVNSATSLTALTPAGIAGAKTVEVTTPAGTGALPNGFTYAALTFTLTVAGAGTGAGTVTSQQGLSPAISCGVAAGATAGDCSRSYSDGTLVTLTATAANGSVFTGWGGACAGTGTCQVTMTTARAVTATFSTAFTLGVTGSGNGAGSVTSAVGVSPAIACAIAAGNATGTCSGSYEAGTVVTLTANAEAGSTFTGWSGACAGTGACQVTLSAARQVTAAFALAQVTTFPLSVTGSGAGSGSVATTAGGPPAIACTITAGSASGTCAGNYADNTLVTLTATPAGGSTFTGWSGACAGTGTCQVTMTAARQVVATFALVQQTFALTVSGAGTGSGAVGSAAGVTPAIACTVTAGATSGTCSGTYVAATVVTLTANPGGSSTFTGWSGACTGTGACQVTMSQARSVTATFTTSTATTATLTVAGAGNGNGSVTAAAATPPIACTITGGSASGSCAQDYAIGTLVVLTPAAANGSAFTGWSGACTGTGACQVTLAAARQVVATFDLTPTTFQLSVTGAGSGAGAVTSAAGTSPAIACGISAGTSTGTCSGAYATGTTVVLTANATDGSTFAGWGGACSGTGTCQVAMSQARAVTATFDASGVTFPLSVTGAGAGAGVVASGAGISPAIACTVEAGQAAGACAGTYAEGTVVALTATPGQGSTFEGWSGACTGTGTCTVTLTAARTVVASFARAPVFRRYLAEGATGLFETRISIANPGTVAANVTLTFLRRDASVRTHSLTVPARQSRKVTVSVLPDMDEQEFSTLIESDEPVIVDRQMWWSKTNAYGTHAEAAVVAPASTWYFAEGATHGGFDLFYLLQNAGDTDATVRVRYLRPTGAPLEKTYTVAARSRFNIWVDYEQFPEGSGVLALADTDVSAVVDVLAGPAIIAERAMYLTPAGSSVRYEAGHESAGVLAPAGTWFLAEGATGAYFDTFVLLANPFSTDAEVRATYLLPNGSTLSKTYTVRANSRFNIWLDYEQFDGVPGLPLEDTAVSTTIESLNGVGVIVERAMWWPGPTPASWAEAHNSPGSTVAGTRWGLAEGVVDGAPTFTETFFLLANTSTSAARVRVTLLFDDGGPEVSREFDVLPRSRFNVHLPPHFPEAAGRGFGAIIESIGTNPAPIVVERAMYNNAGGVRWRAGSNALATQLP